MSKQLKLSGKTFLCVECKKQIAIEFESKYYHLVCQRCAK